MNLAGVTIIVYLALIALVSVYLTKRNKNSADWAIGGGGMGLCS